MNAYEQRQAVRRERLEARAVKLAEQASAAFKKADLSEEASGIPFGQPILVGHHSEGKHRRAIARANAAMNKGVELHKAANEAAGRAESVGLGGISSDDPDAIAKLKTELAEVEARIVAENAANKAIRKGDWAGVAAAVGQERADKEKAFKERWGYCGFHVANRRASALRIKKRIGQLERIAAQRAPLLEAGVEKIVREGANGLEVVENLEANRLQMIFPGKPPATVIAALKSHGFRWAPSEGAWQRQLSNGAKWAAQQVEAVWGE